MATSTLEKEETRGTSLSPIPFFQWDGTEAGSPCLSASSTVRVAMTKSLFILARKSSFLVENVLDAGLDHTSPVRYHVGHWPKQR